MTHPPTSHALTQFAQTLTLNNQRLDQVFADAGTKLGRGMTLFAQLTGNLNLLAGEFGSGDIAATREALGETAAKLRELAVALPEETQHLETVYDRCAAALHALVELRDQMLLVTILARSARIEAASTESGESDFGEFTNEIVDLTARAYQVVEKCVRDHGQLTGLLTSAVARQRDFGNRYAQALPLLFDRLDHSRMMLESRREKSLISTRVAAEKSQTISAAVGAAIVSLQSGDSIRQRVEHIIAMLETASAAVRGEGGGKRLSDEDRFLVVDVLSELAALQLQRAADTLEDDVHQIDRCLDMLMSDIEAITGFSLSLNDAEGGVQGSFLERLEREIQEAADMIRQCDQARSDIGGLTENLNGALNLFQLNIATLSDTVADIVVVGLNAGLRAARLGAGGRGLIVIAEDLKSTADQIAVKADRIITLFEAVQTASQAPLRLEAANHIDVGEIYRTMRRSLASIQESGVSLARTFKQIANEGRSFGHMIENMRQMFGGMATLGAGMHRIGHDVHAMASGSGVAEPRDRHMVQAILQEIWASYTMSAEREIHRALMDAVLPDVEPEDLALAVG